MGITGIIAFVKTNIDLGTQLKLREDKIKEKNKNTDYKKSCKEEQYERD